MPALFARFQFFDFLGLSRLLLRNRQLNPPSQTIPFTLKAEFFQSLPRVKTDLMLLVHNVAPV